MTLSQNLIRDLACGRIPKDISIKRYPIRTPLQPRRQHWPNNSESPVKSQSSSPFIYYYVKGRKANAFHKHIQRHYTIAKSNDVPSFSHANDTTGESEPAISMHNLKMLFDVDNPPLLPSPPPLPPHRDMLKLP